MGLHLNLGSGQRKFDKPWINIDVQNTHNPDIVADISNLPMFADDSAEIIVLHHVLEHFGCGEADGVLKEAWRILAPGGSFLIFVPEMRKIAQRWLVHEIDDFIFMVNTYGAYQGDEHDRHRWGYDTMSLKKYIKSVLGVEAKLFDNRTISGADMAVDWWTLGIEIIKENK